MVVMRADEEFRTIPGLALKSGERFGQRDAVVDGDRQLTFHELSQEMLTVARALTASGVKAGDRVALWAPNSATWMTSALGILASGAWLVPLNTRFKGREAAYVLDKVDARMLLVADGFLDGNQLESLQSENTTLRALDDPVRLPVPGQASRPEWDAFLARSAATPEHSILDQIASLSPDDVSDVIFTSGTTGSPKGVMLRHGTSLRAYQSFNQSFQVGEGDRVLIALPFFHCFGYKAGWMLNVMSGATTFPVPVFDGLQVMATIDRHGITHLPGSPTMFWPLLDDPRRSQFDLSSLRSVIVSATSVPIALLHRLRDELGIEFVMTGYGLTENHALVTITVPSDPPETIATTVGRAIPDLEIKVVDDEGNELPVGGAGELLVRGYPRMTGYYDDPEATAATFKDGWLCTGDVGTVDEDGYVRLTDRKKHIYISGGFNVAPAEVENVLSGYEPIGQVAVVGVPDAYLGEVGAAFVVPKPGQTVTSEDVIKYAQANLANYKVPRVVQIVDSLPMNATGKVLKDELKGQLKSF
jgi:acyl-CoA synthetase (AMP-forming)/AMP-acid ligase II